MGQRQSRALAKICNYQLRVRCQYYSTLGELEDPSPNTPQDQNIMSADGRPIATITPGVAIYVTALLEYIAEYVLQGVARVIERDNSDEASLNELIKAMEEDEATSYWWNKIHTKSEMLALMRGSSHGAPGGGKIQKPWQVPEADELDEAAGRKKFNRQSLTTLSGSQTHPRSASALTPAHERSLSNQNHDSRLDAGNGSTSPVLSQQSHLTSAVSTGDTPGLKRKPSVDRGWFLGRRRGSSFRSSQDLSAQATQRPGSSAGHPDSGLISPPSATPSSESGGDFDSLVMSGQTMKVSLTPNRLRSLNSAGEEVGEDDSKRNARKRPGTLNPSWRANSDAFRSVAGRRPESIQVSGSDARSSVQIDTVEGQDQPLRSSSQASFLRPSSSRGQAKGAPPSAYRGLENESRSVAGHTPDPSISESQSTTGAGDELDEHDRPRTSKRKDLASLMGATVVDGKLVAQNSPRQTNVRDMIDLFNMTPPSPDHGGRFAIPDGRESRMSISSLASNDTTKRTTLSTASGKVFGLFGRKSSMPLGSADSPRRNKEVRLNGAGTPNNESSSKQNDALYHDSTSTAAKAALGTGAAATLGTAAILRHTNSENESKDTHDESSMQRDASMEWSQDSHAPKPSSSKQLPAEPLSKASGEEQKASESGHTGSLYLDPRANTSVSTLSSSTNHQKGDAPSRKVPWNYHRPKSAAGRRGSMPISGTARVGSGSSSHGHNSEALHTSPPSAWSQGAAYDSTTTSSDANYANRTPTVAATTTFGGRAMSPSPRPLGISKSDTARILVQINQRMKDSRSVEECQRIVMQALAAAAAAVHTEHEPAFESIARSGSLPNESSSDAVQTSFRSVKDIPDEDDSMDRDRTDKSPFMTPLLQAPEASLAPTSPISITAVPECRPIKYRNLALPMAIGYDASEDDSLPAFRQQGVIAAWLLDTESNTAPDSQFSEASQMSGSPNGSGQARESFSSVGGLGPDISPMEGQDHTSSRAADPYDSSNTIHTKARVGGKSAAQSHTSLPSKQDDGRLSSVSSVHSTYGDAAEIVDDTE